MLKEDSIKYKRKPRIAVVSTKGNEIKTQDFHLETHSPPLYSKIISKQQNGSAKYY